jgi:hypothetical protein
MRSVLIVLTLLFATTAMAAEPADPGPQRGACREEVKKICAGIKPGDGQLKQCVEANRDKFTPACQERMSRAAEGRGAAVQACKDDVQKLCAGVEHGGGQLHQCLQKNEAQLSEGCRASLKHKPRHPRPAKDPA